MKALENFSNEIYRPFGLDKNDNYVSRESAALCHFAMVTVTVKAIVLLMTFNFFFSAA